MRHNSIKTLPWQLNFLGMKKLSTLLIICSLAVISLNANAQRSDWTIGLSGGLLNVYGDASDYSTFNINGSSPAGALSIQKRFGKAFIPQFQLMGGQMRGRKEYLDVALNGLLVEGSLKAQFDLMKLLNEDSKLEISPNIGIAAGYYSSEITRESTGIPITNAGHVNQGEQFGFAAAWGGRVGYQINETWSAFTGLDMRYYFTDELDAYRGLNLPANIESGNDWTSYIFVGIGYTLGGGGNSGDISKDIDPKRLFNGQFTYNNLPKSGVGLNLYDEEDNLLSTAETDNSGNFSFPGLKPNKEYTVRVVEEDEQYAKNGNIYVINEAKEKVAIADKKGTNRFVYTHITQDDVALLAPVEVDNAETSMKGLFTYKKLAKVGVKLNLYNQSGDKIASTVTDIGGQFKFQGLSPNETYLVKLNEDDEDLFNEGRLYILNSENKRVEKTTRPKFNEFTFEQVGMNAVNQMPILVESDEEAKMKGVFVYNDLPKAGVKVYIVDEKDNKIDSVITGVDGSFQFSELEPNKNYMMRIDEKSVPDTKGVEFFFLNAENEPVMRAGTEKNNKFSFSALPEDEIAGLQVLKVEVAGEGKLLYRRESVDGEYIEASDADSAQVHVFDVVEGTPDSKDKPVNKKTNIYNVDFEKETIYFEHNKYSISQDQTGSKGSVIAKKMKDNPAMRIQIQGYASQPGTEAYNSLLSQRRADELKELLIEKYGIDKGRIEAIRKGEDPSTDEN